MICYLVNSMDLKEIRRQKRQFFLLLSKIKKISYFLDLTKAFD